MHQIALKTDGGSDSLAAREGYSYLYILIMEKVFLFASHWSGIPNDVDIINQTKLETRGYYIKIAYDIFRSLGESTVGLILLPYSPSPFRGPIKTALGFTRIANIFEYFFNSTLDIVISLPVHQWIETSSDCTYEDWSDAFKIDNSRPYLSVVCLKKVESKGYSQETLFDYYYRNALYLIVDMHLKPWSLCNLMPLLLPFMNILLWFKLLI